MNPSGEYVARGYAVVRRGRLPGHAFCTAPGNHSSRPRPFLPGTVGSALGQRAGALIKALRERRRSVRALAGRSRPADRPEAAHELEARSFCPDLLARDPAQLPADKSALPVILPAPYEDTGTAPTVTRTPAPARGARSAGMAAGPPD
ncbi:hypothetical protein EASAB2608_06502 [Streptomyces sp. EAS-AB2608]|nr:hypothetical protein EASAB2608_06502 [Streptomyces sp. EAS-AB2608]